MVCRAWLGLLVCAGCMDYDIKRIEQDPGWGEPVEEPDAVVEIPVTPADPPEPAREPPDPAREPPEVPHVPVDVPGEAVPDIAADPPQVDARGFCVDDTRVVTVWNEGEAPLTVTRVGVTGAGWSLEPVATPFTLEPGRSVALPLATTGGAGTLHVESDDPDEPRVSIPLVGVANQPPTARILDPVDGVVVAEGGDLVLSGVVFDDLDAPDSLGVTWSASVDGVLGGGPPAPDGTVWHGWAAGARAVGEQSVSLTATDSCGFQATDTTGLCQDASHTYDALDLTGWHYEGMAYYDRSDAWLVLTDANEYEVGTAFETSSPVDAGHVTLDFTFWIGGGTGADGISVTALDTERMTTFLGGDGCGIGYGGDARCTDGPALPGWSIEVDTWYNDGHDPTRADHLALTIDGDVDDPEVLVELPEMEDNGWHTMQVEVVAPRVTVTIDGVTWIDEDVDGVGSFPAYVGFTAGTGGATNWHIIDALEVTERACDTD